MTYKERSPSYDYEEVSDLQGEITFLNRAQKSADNLYFDLDLQFKANNK